MENKETLDSNKRPSIDRFIENYEGGSLKMLVDFIDRYHQDFWFVIAKDINPLTKVTFHDTYVRDKLLENKKLNGFNNGRDTLDGVGGEKPFIVYEHPTNDLPETSVLGIDHYTKKETLETKVFTALGLEKDTDKFFLIDVNLIDTIEDFEKFTLYAPPVLPHLDAYIARIDIPTEKTYQFTESTGINNCTILNLKESELEQKHKDLLIGQLIKDFENLPDSLKQNTLNILNEKTT